MARGRSRVEKGSDIHALHPFLVFFFSYLFSFLGGLEPTHTPVRSPAPLPAPLPSPQPLQVDMPHVECKDQDPQDLPALGESKERQQGEESREDEAGRGSARSQVSSPSIATSSANRQLMMLEGKSGSYFSSLDSSIDILKKRAQELIENINESRQKDHALMTNFRDSLKIKVSDLTEKLEERMYQIYNHHNKIIQDKLQEFTQKMAKISHLETELKQVCHTVETVYKDLCVQPEATTSEEQAHKDGEF
ncbi:synaptonemal complex central element protein 2 isoform X5 [Lutra lutra]|uniref:synaptonemal complex central element protein 2 isoform X5 n=1 Tax=Lutra lutra TaxID=9657 RepID=UPI001FD43D8A|nr:synaptonemal complex central element protein 2 isoform X5 [Lutra lutra]